jgi:crotonobetaine/carnitine-CoA ligase
MGRAVPEFECKVVDEHDEDLPSGVPGELLIRPKEPFSIATGYFRMADWTVAAWRNLWFHTGDRVVCNEYGVFRFLDRLNDSIRRRGENMTESGNIRKVVLRERGVGPATSDREKAGVELRR